MRSPGRPHLAILGAGPVGLEAALAAAERGLEFTVYEAAARPAGHVRSWGHVRAFTPWSMNVSARARRALRAAGSEPPDGPALPTGAELCDELLDPLAHSAGIAPRLRLDTRVRALAREGLLKHEEIGTAARSRRPFRLLVEDAGGERVEHADAVFDCSGSYGQPNRLGDGGIPAPGELRLAERIARRLPDLRYEAGEWAGRTVLLTGAGHSAQTAARDLAELARVAPGTRVVWAVRASEPDWQAVDDDPLPERARLSAEAVRLAGGASPAVEVRCGRVTEALSEREGRLCVTLRNAQLEEIVVDRVLALNGGVGDHALYRQLQVQECYATAGPIKLAAALLGEEGGGDCLAQRSHGPETLATPEPGFFVLGAKSYGRNSRFLARIGWRQVDDALGLIDRARGAPPLERSGGP